MKKHILTFFIFILIGISLVSCGNKENEVTEEDKIIIESFDYEINRIKSSVANELSYSLSFNINFSLNHKFDVKDLVVRIEPSEVATGNQKTFQVAIDYCNTADVMISDPNQYPYTHNPYIEFKYAIVDVATFNANAQVKITSKDIINNIDNFIKIRCHSTFKKVVDEHHLLKEGYFNIAFSDDSLIYYEFDEFSESYTLVSAVNRFYTLEIPATYKGYPVKAIGAGAFYDCSYLENITIPDSVTSIERAAFFGCSHLTSIVIPDSVTSIGKSAFEGCANLVYNEYDNAYYLGNEENPYLVLIKAKSTDITTCEIHNKTKFICHNAFEECKNLTRIEIPNSVKRIEKRTFYNCGSLTSITIPDSVTSIGEYAFWDCRSLRSIRISSSINSIEESAFEGCINLVYNEYDNAYYLGNEENPYVVLMEVKSREITTCEIHSNTRFIYENAFYYCSSLNNIEIPSNVIGIGRCAFCNCSSFTCIVIPNSVKSIGLFAFSHCSSLESIVIPVSITIIGDGTFDNCNQLKEVYYKGITSQWNSIEIGLHNSSLNSATIYYYSETKPIEDGNYWHYVDGKVTKW